MHLGWDFFDLHKALEDILGSQVDPLTRRSVEQDQILESTREIYAA
jgi:hypothetical protein